MSSEAWSALLGAFMPWVIEILKAKLPLMSRQQGYLISIGISMLAGLVGILITSQFSTKEILESFSAAIVASQTIYNLYFKPLNLDQGIQTKLGGVQ